MSTKFKQMLFELTEQLSFINLEMDDPIAKSEKSVELTLKAIDNLKKQFLKINQSVMKMKLIFLKT